jgi:hypothetical protein
MQNEGAFLLLAFCSLVMHPSCSSRVNSNIACCNPTIRNVAILPGEIDQKTQNFSPSLFLIARTTEGDEGNGDAKKKRTISGKRKEKP